jgi:hypothetical protein
LIHPTAAIPTNLVAGRIVGSNDFFAFVVLREVVGGVQTKPFPHFFLSTVFNQSIRMEWLLRPIESLRS